MLPPTFASRSHLCCFPFFDPYQAENKINLHCLMLLPKPRPPLTNTRHHLSWITLQSTIKSDKVPSIYCCSPQGQKNILNKIRADPEHHNSYRGAAGLQPGHRMQVTLSDTGRRTIGAGCGGTGLIGQIRVEIHTREQFPEEKQEKKLLYGSAGAYVLMHDTTLTPGSVTRFQAATFNEKLKQMDVYACPGLLGHCMWSQTVYIYCLSCGCRYYGNWHVKYRSSL